MKQSKGMFHNAVILFTALSATKLVGSVFKIFLGNILGGIGMGYFSTAYSVFQPIYALTVSAFPVVITRLVATNIANGKLCNVRKIKSLALKLSGLIGFAGTVLIILISAPFAVYISGSPESIPAMFLIAPSLFFCSVAAVYKGYFEGFQNMMPTAISQIVEVVFKSIFGITLTYYVLEKTGSVPYSAAAAVLGITISEVAGTLFLALRSKILSDGITKNDLLNSPPADISIDILKNIYKDALPIIVAALVMNISSLIDLMTITNSVNIAISSNKTYFLEHFTYGLQERIELKDIGTFIYGSYTGIVASIFGLIPSMTGLVSKSALAGITAAYESHNSGLLTRDLKILFKGTFMIGFPMCFGLAALAEPILSLIYYSKPSEVSISVLPLQILALGGITLGISGALFSIFQAIGRTDMQIKLTLIGSVIKFLGNVMLVRKPEININGAAISTILCYTLISVVGIIALQRIVKRKLNIHIHFIKALLNSIICAFSAFVSYYYIFNYFSDAKRLIISIIIAATSYLVLTLITDKDLIGDFFANRLRRKKNKI